MPVFLPSCMLCSLYHAFGLEASSALQRGGEQGYTNGRAKKEEKVEEKLQQSPTFPFSSSLFLLFTAGPFIHG